MSDKIIKRDELNVLLQQIFPFNENHRNYVKKIFENDLIDGISEYDLRDKVSKMKYNQHDEIDEQEAERIKNKLLENLNKK
jgi:hypothetical protein